MADLSVRLNRTLFVWRTIRVKEIPTCRDETKLSWAAQLKHPFGVLFLTAPPYPQTAISRPVWITGELFPGDTKERRVK